MINENIIRELWRKYCICKFDITLIHDIIEDYELIKAEKYRQELAEATKRREERNGKVE